jgi:hypothetical protein
MKTLNEQQFEDGSSVRTYEHDEPEGVIVQTIYHVRCPDGRTELVEEWRAKGAARTINSLDDARGVVKANGGWDAPAAWAVTGSKG